MGGLYCCRLPSPERLTLRRRASMDPAAVACDGAGNALFTVRLVDDSALNNSGRYTGSTAARQLFEVLRVSSMIVPAAVVGLVAQGSASPLPQLQQGVSAVEVCACVRAVRVFASLCASLSTSCATSFSCFGLCAVRADRCLAQACCGATCVTMEAWRGARAPALPAGALGRLRKKAATHPFVTKDSPGARLKEEGSSSGCLRGWRACWFGA